MNRCIIFKTGFLKTRHIFKFVNIKVTSIETFWPPKEAQTTYIIYVHNPENSIICTYIASFMYASV